MRKTLIAAGLLEVGALAAMGWIPGARGTPAPALLLWGLAWIGHLWAWRALAEAPDAAEGPGGSAAAPAPSRRTVLWTVGIVGRLALLPLLPTSPRTCGATCGTVMSPSRA